MLFTKEPKYCLCNRRRYSHNNGTIKKFDRLIVTNSFSKHTTRSLGVDPNEMRFKRAAFFDVGLECGGLGRIVMESYCC